MPAPLVRKSRVSHSAPSEGRYCMTLLVNSKTPQEAILHPTLKGQRDRGRYVEPCTPMRLEIQQLRLNQQSLMWPSPPRREKVVGSPRAGSPQETRAWSGPS